ncbi:MAG: hypothetical protein IMZ74_15335 [Actinobacteria bacterium]|nr:hypothetical protein [Actinomycetota bacterium]
MHAVVASPDGTQVIRSEASGPSSDAAGLGRRVAEDLARRGATQILDDCRLKTAD